jgi:hypothetical protein
MNEKMGSFVDNLLKLTEFPFSYSFISLLTFMIFGESILEDATLEKIGPFLILMGFVGTTLSITDPIGRIQKIYLKSGSRKLEPKIRRYLDMQVFGFTVKMNNYTVSSKSQSKMRRRLSRHLNTENHVSGEKGLPMATWREHFMEEPVFRSTVKDTIPVGLLTCLLSNFEEIFKRLPDSGCRANHLDYNMALCAVWEEREVIELELKISSLLDHTLRTVWIQREIDKITSTLYFVIVVITFFVAVIFVPNFADNFLAGFPADLPVVKWIIVGFSAIALGTVSYIIRKRLRELRQRATTTFIFFIQKDAIKVHRHRFENRLQEIERYLNAEDWVLAWYVVSLLIDEYEAVITQSLPELKRGEKIKEKHPTTT